MASIFGSDKSSQPKASDIWTHRGGLESEPTPDTAIAPQDARTSFYSHLEDRKPGSQARSSNQQVRKPSPDVSSKTSEANPSSQSAMTRTNKKASTPRSPLSDNPKRLESVDRSANKAELPNVPEPNRKLRTDLETSSSWPQLLQDSQDSSNRSALTEPKNLTDQVPKNLTVNKSQILRDIVRQPETTLESMIASDHDLSPVPLSVLNLSFNTPSGIQESQELLAAQILESLEALGFTLGGRDAMMSESPLLALFSGHIEQVIPPNLPTLVSTNPLMQTILASDSNTVFQSPQPLQNILQQLGLEQSPLAQALKNSSFLKAETSLSHALQALGFDPKAVEQAAYTLAQTVEDGQLPDLMIRLAKWKAQHQAEELGGTLALASQMAQVRFNQSPLQSQATKENLKATSQQFDSSAGLLTGKQRDLMPSGLWIEDRSNDTLIPLEASEDFRVSDGIQAFLAKSPLPSTQSNPVVKHTGQRIGNSDPRPQVPLASNDPFAAIAAQWQAGDIQSFVFEPLSAEQSLLKQDLVPPTQGDQALEQSSPEASIPSFSVQGAENLDSSLSMKDNSSTKSNLGEPLSRSTLQTPIIGDSRTRGDSSQSDQNLGSSSRDDTANLFQNVNQKSESKSLFSLQNVENQQQAQPLQSAESLQKIFDRASMMVKEGGGSIRVDLGEQGLGSVDLALDIKDKTVELRILTSSPQARELLSQELPRLRESLMQQNLNLEKVEIGLGGGSGWSQSSSQDQSRGQSFQWASEASYRGPTGSRDVRSYSQASTTRQVGVNPLHKGLIQVRV